MKILAIDTTTGICSAAIFSDGKIIISNTEQGTATQAEKIIPMIEDVLRQSSMRYADINYLACTMGPGSFTGVRIGMSAIKGIAFATKIPSVGINTMETMAWKISKKTKGKILSLLNAMRGEVYAQIFESGSMAPVTEPSLIKLEELSSFSTGAAIVSGNCPEIAKEFLPNMNITEKVEPHAADVAELVEFKIKNGQKLHDLVPLYIRKPDAKVPKNFIHHDN